MDTDHLLNLADQGDSKAVAELFSRHKQRLRNMVNVRLDARLSARLDPSDLVQETLAEAHKKLPRYLKERAIPFYPWLRAIAWEKLVQTHRKHIHAERRTVKQEAAPLSLSGDSRMILVDKLAASTASPSRQIVHQELVARLETAISQLPPIDHEVIVLKHLEEMTFSETAAVLGVSEEAVRSRYRRAVQRLHRMLSDE